jgi:hypothetical protein
MQHPLPDSLRREVEERRAEMSEELGNWHLGPALGGPNMWQDGDTLLIAVQIKDGWHFAIVGINADEDQASMEDEYGELYSECDFTDISYWMHQRDMELLLPPTAAAKKGGR